MKLYLLRHGIAESIHTADSDSSRALTPEGIRQMHENALGLKKLGLSFDFIFSSPYLRARRTAEIVLESFDIALSEIRETQNLEPDAPHKPLVKELDQIVKSSSRVLLVGHEPNLTGLISYLLIGKGHIPINLKKGGLCCLTADKPLVEGGGTLDSILDPPELRKLAGA